MEKQSSKRRKLTHSPREAQDENDMSAPEDLSEDSMSTSNALDEGIPMANEKPRNRAIAPNATRAHVKPRSSSDIYTSDLFQIQVAELLEVVQPNYGKWMARVEEALRKLKRIIEGLPSRPPLQVATYSKPGFLLKLIAAIDY